MKTNEKIAAAILACAAVSVIPIPALAEAQVSFDCNSFLKAKVSVS